MKAIAPGKLLLSGAYVVLEGAPAIVCAVDRHAIAFDEPSPHPTREIAAALDKPCSVDVSALEDDGQKLGLGSSAAALVAALALRAHQDGKDVASGSVRHEIFERAREVHARVQGGGSGVDVAASTFGGVLRFAKGIAEPVEPPPVHLAAFFSGRSARTSDLRARVARLATENPGLYVERMGDLAACAVGASEALADGDVALFIIAVADHLGALTQLGSAADAPIVLPAFAELGHAARDEAAAFIPSGAGGGDVGVFVGINAPSASFHERARALSMKHVPVSIDPLGVRVT